jgi:hypothetical protein
MARSQGRVEPARDPEADNGPILGRAFSLQEGSEARRMAASSDYGYAGSAGDASLTGEAGHDENEGRRGHIPKVTARLLPRLRLR